MSVFGLMTVNEPLVWYSTCIYTVRCDVYE